MALYGTVQRNDAAPNAPQSTYGGMFARNDAPAAPVATSASPQASETGYGRYGSRPRQDGGAWQGSRPGGTTGAIGGVRGGWGGAGGGWGQPGAGSIYANRQQPASSNGWTQGQSPRTPEMQAEMAANAAKRVPGSRDEFGDVWGERAVPPSSAQSMSPAPISYQTAELQRRAEAGRYPTVGARYGSQDQMNYAPAPTAADMNRIFTIQNAKSPGHQNIQQTYNGQPIDWSLPADKIPPPNAQQLAEWERQSAIDTQRNVPANFRQQYDQMQAQSDFWANQRNPQSAPNVQFDPRVANLANRQTTPASGGWLSRPPSGPAQSIEEATRGGFGAPLLSASANRGYSQEATNFLTGGPFNSQIANLVDRQTTPVQSGGSALANATNWANQMNSASPMPSVVPGIKSGPDEFGGAPAQTPSVQFNTPWQRLGVSGYGAGNAAQGAFSEQTGQAGAPAPPSAPASPVGLSYQPLPQWANVNPGPIASPTVQFSTPVQRLGIDPFASQTASPRASMIPTPADIERARQLALASPTGQPGSPFDRAVAAGTPGAIPVQSSYGGMFAR